MPQVKGKPINDWIPRCGKPRRKGRGPCRAVMMKNGMGCRIHGGKTPVGIDSPQYNPNTRNSSAIKRTGPKLEDRVAKALEDRTLLELNGQIAIVQALVEDLFEKLCAGQGDGGSAIKKIKKTYESTMAALYRGDRETFNAMLQESLSKAIDEADYQFALLEELRSTMKLRKELTDSQSKREIQLEQMMKAEDVKIIINAVLAEMRGVLYDRIEDKSHAADVCTEISQKVARVLGGQPNNGPSRALQAG